MSVQAATSSIAPSPAATISQEPWQEPYVKDGAPRWQIATPATQTSRSENGSKTMAPEALATPVSLPPPLRPDPHRFVAIQKWEGYVTEVGAETFWVRLVPLLGEGGDQEAEIYVEEIDRADRNLIEPGAVFYWSIGYLDGPSGRLRASYIRFRRLPAWTQRDLEAAKDRATLLHDLFNVPANA